MSCDDLDRGIIAKLNDDGRASNKDIAASLGVSEGTVRNRVGKLTEFGALKVAGLVNPDLSPGKQLVLLGVNLSCSKELTRRAEEIAALSGVLAVHITAGRYDLIVEVWLDTKSGLIGFLSGPLAHVEGVVSTESFLVMKSYNRWIPRPDL